MATTKDIINALPDAAKNTVLRMLVGSLNASIVGTANAVVAQMESENEVDFKEMEPRDVISFLNGPDESDERFRNIRKTMRVTESLRDMLKETANDDEAGSIMETLAFMQKPNVREFDKNIVEELAKAANIACPDVNLLNAANKVRRTQDAERLAKNAGNIEWLIGNVFTAPEVALADGEVVEVEGDIEELPDEQREKVLGKLAAALSRARDDAFVGVLNRDSRYSMSDLPLIAAAIEQLKTVH